MDSDETRCEVVLTEVDIHPSRYPLEPEMFEQKEYGPSPSSFYVYKWGNRAIDRGNMVSSLLIQPGVVLLDQNQEQSGPIPFETLQAAKLYCSQYEGKEEPSIVISTYVEHGEGGFTLLGVERGDYEGYLMSLTFASQLTGIPFLKLAEGGNMQEEPLSIHWRIRQLRRLRRRCQDAEASILEMEIRDDFRSRHMRNIR